MKQTQENNNQMENEFTLSTSETPVLRLSPSSFPLPFSMTFSYNGTAIKVELENGEDVLKLAQIFSDFLTSNDIANKVIKE
jgi:hypothetical protein